MTSSQIPDPPAPRSGVALVRPVHPPLRLRGGPLWAWALLVVAVLVTLAVEFVASFLIALSYVTACYEPASAVDVVAGQRALSWLLAAVATPWVVATVWVRLRLRVAVAGLVCTARRSWSGSTGSM